LVRKSKKRFLDPNLAAKMLRKNLDSVRIRETLDDNITHTPDQLNTFFATLQTVRLSNTDSDCAYDSLPVEFAFINTFQLGVYNAVHKIRSNAFAADGLPIKFLKIILPHILSYVIHVFNTVFMSSSYPVSWKLSNIMPMAKNNDPGNLSDYRPISILPALSNTVKLSYGTGSLRTSK
jgi:hypothetical protein